jgi:hypothetical protein
VVEEEVMRIVGEEEEEEEEGEEEGDESFHNQS